MIGQAKTEIGISDISVVRDTGIKGIIGVLGPTQRGPINTPTLIGSWLQFTRIFGGFQTDNDFPLLCRRILDRGGKIRVNRIGHYQDITDKTTLQGSQASYSGSKLVIKASSIGTWGNGIKVKIEDNSTFEANTLRLSLALEGYPDLSETFKIPTVPTSNDFSEIRNKTTLIGEITSDAETGDPVSEIAETYFTNGEDNSEPITVADYVGDPTQGVGLNAFDNITDCVKISAPGISDPIFDAAIISYADTRKDLLAVIRTPVGLNDVGIIDYRNGTGAYSHQAYDSWRAIMTTGGLKINHPTTSERIEINELADCLGLMSKKDNDFAEWFSFGGPKRGKITDALGVVYNLGTAARRTAADSVDNHGVNAVIEHPSFGVVLWGNSTLQKKNTLLKHANVAEIMIYLTRALKPLIESELFEPNDIQTWKTIYRRVKPLLDSVQEQRGIWKYLYQGDQNIDDVSQAVVNSTEDIDAGKYVFHLFIAPKVAMKYLAVKVIITNSGVDFEDIAE